MRSLQLLFLALFALCSILSFFARIRMGMLNGAMERSDQFEPSTKKQSETYYRTACILAIFAALFLIACIIVGVLMT